MKQLFRTALGHPSYEMEAQRIGLCVQSATAVAPARPVAEPTVEPAVPPVTGADRKLSTRFSVLKDFKAGSFRASLRRNQNVSGRPAHRARMSSDGIELTQIQEPFQDLMHWDRRRGTQWMRRQRHKQHASLRQHYELQLGLVVADGGRAQVMAHRRAAAADLASAREQQQRQQEEVSQKQHGQEQEEQEKVDENTQLGICTLPVSTTAPASPPAPTTAVHCTMMRTEKLDSKLNLRPEQQALDEGRIHRAAKKISASWISPGLAATNSPGHASAKPITAPSASTPVFNAGQRNADKRPSTSTGGGPVHTQRLP